LEKGKREEGCDLLIVFPMENEREVGPLQGIKADEAKAGKFRFRSGRHLETRATNKPADNVAERDHISQRCL
jgi:hypothetical protein